MKLVNSHVMTVSGVGDVMESEFSYNSKMSAVPHGPCPLLMISSYLPLLLTFFHFLLAFILKNIETRYELTKEIFMIIYLALV